MRARAKNQRPMFVSFSGIDGAGKSTQIENLRARMQEAGPVSYTHLPAGYSWRSVVLSSRAFANSIRRYEKSSWYNWF